MSIYSADSVLSVSVCIERLVLLITHNRHRLVYIVEKATATLAAAWLQCGSVVPRAFAA